MLMKLSPDGLNFTNMFMHSFYVPKKDTQVISVFFFLGSARAIAATKKFVKLTPVAKLNHTPKLILMSNLIFMLLNKQIFSAQHSAKKA
jgi:hypothetical protein